MKRLGRTDTCLHACYNAVRKLGAGFLPKQRHRIGRCTVLDNKWAMRAPQGGCGCVNREFCLDRWHTMGIFVLKDMYPAHVQC